MPDPVTDRQTHKHLDRLRKRIEISDKRLSTIDNKLSVIDSHLTGLHDDLVRQEQLLEENSQILQAQLTHLDALSNSLALRSTSVVSAAGTQVPVVARFEYSSGDLIISSLLAVSLLVEFGRILIGSVRGVRV